MSGLTVWTLQEAFSIVTLRPNTCRRDTLCSQPLPYLRTNAFLRLRPGFGLCGGRNGRRYINRGSLQHYFLRDSRSLLDMLRCIV